MTFPSAVGHGNFPNGNAFPTIFAKELMLNLKENLISNAITNTKYEGEISNYGDTVNVLKENTVQVTDYARGATIPLQQFTDEQVQLTIDQGKTFGFVVDEVEQKLSHIDWISSQNARAAFDLKKAIDLDILGVMRDNATTNAGIGLSGSPVTVNYSGGSTFTPLNYLARLDKLLSQNDVPMDGRFVAIDPDFKEQLVQEEGSLADASVTGNGSVLTNANALFGGRKLHGFTLYESTNMPTSAGGDTIVLAGRKEATTTATALAKTRIEHVPQSFTQVFLGLTVYGRKVMRPEQLFCGNVSFS